LVKVAETYLRESAVSICVNLRKKRGLGEGGTWGLGERTKCKEPKLKKMFVVYGLWLRLWMTGWRQKNLSLILFKKSILYFNKSINFKFHL